MNWRTTKLPTATTNSSTNTTNNEKQYMTLGQAYSKLNSMAKAYNVETDATKKQKQYNDFVAFGQTLDAAIADPSMPQYYNPYTRATNYNIVDNLKKYYGVDLSSGITQDTIDALKQNVDYSKISYNYGGSIASNTKDANQQLAYYIAMLEDDEAITQKAESELKSLQDDIWMLVQQGYSDTDITKKIDMSDYPTLTKMDEGKQTNTPLTLNRRVNYSQDYLPAYIWAARNDYQLNNDDSYVTALIGSYDKTGNQYTPSTKSYASLDPSSEYFAPYGQTTTLFDLGSKYHTASFDHDWLNAHKSEMLNGDETAQKEYNKIYDAVETADTATAELESLNKWRDEQLAKGKTSDEILSALNKTDDDGKSAFEESYPTLAKMEKKRLRGAALELGYAVDFSMPIFESVTRETEQNLQAEAAKKAAEEAEMKADASAPPAPSQLAMLHSTAGVGSSSKTKTAPELAQSEAKTEQKTEQKTGQKTEQPQKAEKAESVSEESTGTVSTDTEQKGESTSTETKEPFSLSKFRSDLAGLNQIEQNTAESNLEEGIAAYKNGTPLNELSEEARSFIETYPLLFEGEKYYEVGYDTVRRGNYNAIVNATDDPTFGTVITPTFYETGIGEEVANALDLADRAVNEGYITPEENAAFIIGVAEAMDKANAAGLTLEEYLNSDEAEKESVLGTLNRTIDEKVQERLAYEKQVQEEFTQQYIAARDRELNGTATDEDASILEQIRGFNIDFSKDTVYQSALEEIKNEANELWTKADFITGSGKVGQMWMMNSPSESTLMSVTVQQAAMDVYQTDMRAARMLGYENLTDFYDANPGLEESAQNRATAVMTQKIEEYNAVAEEADKLYQTALQSYYEGKGKFTFGEEEDEDEFTLDEEESKAHTYTFEEAIDKARKDIDEYVYKDAQQYGTLADDSSVSNVEAAPEEERWGLVEGAAKTTWKGIKSGTVQVPLSFAQAIEYYFLIPLHWIDNDTPRGFARLPLSQDMLSQSMFAFGRKLLDGTLSDEYKDGFSNDMLQTVLGIVLDQIPDTSIFSSFIDVMTNETWYGTQMTSDYKQGLSEVNQTNNNMPAIFNWIAAKLSANGSHGAFTSPIALKYMFQQNTGVIGQFLIPMLSPDANGNINPLRGIWTAWRNSMTLDAAYTNKVRTAYSDLVEVIDKTVNDGNAGGIGGQLRPGLSAEEAAEAYQQAIDLQKGVIKETTQRVNEVYAEINAINANDTLKPGQKESLSENTYKEITALFRRHG